MMRPVCRAAIGERGPLRRSRFITYVATGAPVVLAVLAVVGAFLGADRSRALFSSAPLIAFWVLLLGSLIWGAASLRRPVGQAGLFAAYTGGVFVLVGSMWGSDAGHRVRARLLGARKVPQGFMVVGEGQTARRILDESLSSDVGQLDFGLRLEGFWPERDVPEEMPGPSAARGAGVPRPRMVRDYKSRLAVTRHGETLLRQVVEVNRPLHFGGYHFHQHAHDPYGRAYTVLAVRSDSGLRAVYVGFALVLAGVVWRCWARPVWGWAARGRH